MDMQLKGLSEFEARALATTGVVRKSAPKSSLALKHLGEDEIFAGIALLRMQIWRLECELKRRKENPDAIG